MTSNTDAGREELINLALSIVDSESFMWLMMGSNHPDLHIARLRELYMTYRNAGGGFQ